MLYLFDSLYVKFYDVINVYIVCIVSKDGIKYFDFNFLIKFDNVR